MEGSTGRHYHNYDFQIMYVTNGWVKMYYKGEGELVLKTGDFVYHPKGHVHNFMEYSHDIEILEIASPAHHHSIDVEESVSRCPRRGRCFVSGCENSSDNFSGPNDIGFGNVQIGHGAHAILAHGTDTNTLV